MKKLPKRWRGVATIIAGALLIAILTPIAIEKRTQKGTKRTTPSPGASKAGFVEHTFPHWGSR